MCPQCVEFTAIALTHLAVSPASVLPGLKNVITAPVQVSVSVLMMLMTLTVCLSDEHIKHHNMPCVSAVLIILQSF